MSKKVPYKVYLNENELPKAWYNIAADMPNKIKPALNPATQKPAGPDDFSLFFQWG